MTADPFWAQDRFGGAADAVYATLIAAHEGLSEAQSAALDARLVLLLAHAVGDPARIAEAARLARDGMRRGAEPPDATTSTPLPATREP